MSEFKLYPQSVDVHIKENFFSISSKLDHLPILLSPSSFLYTFSYIVKYLMPLKYFLHTLQDQLCILFCTDGLYISKPFVISPKLSDKYWKMNFTRYQNIKQETAVTFSLKKKLYACSRQKFRILF